MSQYFVAEGKTLWNPSNGVAQQFARSVEAIAPTVGLPTGLGPDLNDEYEIEMTLFVGFIDALVRRYCSSTHLILQTLIEGVAAIGIVLTERTGSTVPALSQPVQTIDPHDVAIYASGPGAVGNPARLRALADQCDAAMSR